MPCCEFYLWGEEPSTALAIEVPEAASFDDLQQLVASHMAIVEPSGEDTRPDSPGATHTRAR